MIGAVCFFHGLHLTFHQSHDTTFKQATKPLISVNSTPSSQFWRLFWYEWGISRETMPTIPIVLMINGPLWWWLPFWIILSMSSDCFALVVFWLPDYPNCHNCIAMGRLLHASLINLINIRGPHTHATQSIINNNKSFSLSLQNIINSYFLWLVVATVWKANSNHRPVTLSQQSTALKEHNCEIRISTECTFVTNAFMISQIHHCCSGILVHHSIFAKVHTS